MTMKIPFKKTLATLLVGTALAFSGCDRYQNVSINRIENIKTEEKLQPGVLELVEGTPIASEYTLRSKIEANYLSFSVRTQDNKLQECYIDDETRLNSGENVSKYNRASTIVKSAIALESKVRVIGKSKPEYFEIQSLEVNGLKISFE